MLFFTTYSQRTHLFLRNRWRSYEFFLLPPYAAAWFQHTSVKLHQTGTYEGHSTDWAIAPCLIIIFLSLNYRHGPPGGRPRQSRFLFQSGTELDNSTRLEDRHSTQCHRFEPPKDFFVIGHSGGDPLKHCENTLEATRLFYFINLFEGLKGDSSREV